MRHIISHIYWGADNENESKWTKSRAGCNQGPGGLSAHFGQLMVLQGKSPLPLYLPFLLYNYPFLTLNKNYTGTPSLKHGESNKTKRFNSNICYLFPGESETIGFLERDFKLNPSVETLSWVTRDRRNITFHRRKNIIKLNQFVIWGMTKTHMLKVTICVLIRILSVNRVETMKLCSLGDRCWTYQRLVT